MIIELIFIVDSDEGSSGSNRALLFLGWFGRACLVANCRITRKYLRCCRYSCFKCCCSKATKYIFGPTLVSYLLSTDYILTRVTGVQLIFHLKHENT